MSGGKLYWLAQVGVSGDHKGDLERADKLESKALALDPDWTWPHRVKGLIFAWEARYQEAITEHERALALDPVAAVADLGDQSSQPPTRPFPSPSTPGKVRDGG